MIEFLAAVVALAALTAYLAAKPLERYLWTGRWRKEKEEA
jgi:hypothetical protein